jgi:hypothetical protein
MLVCHGEVGRGLADSTATYVAEEDRGCIVPFSVFRCLVGGRHVEEAHHCTAMAALELDRQRYDVAWVVVDWPLDVACMCCICDDVGLLAIFCLA